MEIVFDPTSKTERATVRGILDRYDTDEGAGDTGATGTSGSKSTGGIDPADFIKEVGANSFQFVEEAVKHFGVDNEFTFEELSTKSGISVDTLKSYHRNLSRTAKWFGGTIGEVIPSRWDDVRNHYKIPKALWDAHLDANSKP